MFDADDSDRETARPLERLEAEICELAGQLAAGRAGTASHLERIARGYRRVQRCQQTGEDRRHADRYLRWHWDDEGALVLRVRLAPEEGAGAGGTCCRARAPARAGGAVGGSPHPDRLPAERPPTGASLTRPEPQPDTPDADVSAETPARSTADALVTMAETLLAAGPAHLVGDDRYQVVVHVDLDTLRAAPVPPLSGVTRAVDRGRHAAASRDVGPLGVRQRAAGHRRRRRRHPLDVGRKSRCVPAGIRRALRCRDGGCRFPGCTERRHVDAHHIWHWARGGPTSLAKDNP